MFLNEIISNENYVNRLIEERGVAATQFKPQVKQILQFCQVMASSIDNGGALTLKIPETITRKFEFVEKLVIEVTIEDGFGLDYNGGGSVNVTKVGSFQHNKLDEVIIKISGYAYDGVLYDRSILTSLYHELNHLYDFWKAKTENHTMSRAVKTIQKTGMRLSTGSVTSDPTINKLLKNILYRLFSETELNAVAASVYGDLEGLKSQRSNYKDDIVKTKAYYIYNQFKTNLEYVFNHFMLYNNEIPNLRALLNSCDISLSPYGTSDIAYLKDFVRKCKFLLKRLYTAIGKVASKYYDDDEFQHPNHKISTNYFKQ